MTVHLRRDQGTPWIGSPFEIEVEERGGRIEHDLGPGLLVVGRGEPVGPRIKKRDTGSAALRGGGFEVVEAAQDFNALMPQRHAEHAEAREKARLEVTGDKRRRRRVIEGIT